MQLDAVIFDTDGVLTQTASTHFSAWKTVFDRFLSNNFDDEAARPFTDTDYREYVDGVPRYDGVAAFLGSRGLELPWGDPDDPAGASTICELGNAKNEEFVTEVDIHGVAPYLTTRRFIEQLHDAGVRTAVISASKNCATVLDTAGLSDLFEVRVDGNDAAQIGLPGKPDPAVFLEAARRLGVEPERAAIVEDAIAGVEAGRTGGFGLVIGLDRTGHPGPLAAFADIVVPDAADLSVTDRRVSVAPSPRSRLRDLPRALDSHDLTRRMSQRKAAVFLDYDGTLTPIVDHPDDAQLALPTLDAVRALATTMVVGIISGRDLDDVRSMVDTNAIWFAGSHGFDVVAPDGTRQEFDEGLAALPQLDLAEKTLLERIDDFPGAWVERKRFAIAVHYRAAADDLIDELESAVATTVEPHDALRMTGGKKIFEVRPAVAWDKGKALQWLTKTAGLEADDTIAIYVGDDVTDEDAFVAITATGVGVVVGTEDRPTAARYRVDDTDEVRAFLQRLAKNVPA